MDSFVDECTALKHLYDECFNKWFAEKFLQGQTKEDVACQNIFVSYQSCLKRALKAKNINMAELEKDMLGTQEEKK